ncbi:uncharacterized protein CCR75_002726 [Bremia lactucae]|uniref:Secreted protein n=1 Tax=Bremia lactucae TaxID=4779 RepID=A0A976FG31_BRELC|nr:hypothetical protein CCR75_002726 [Bremia lactucae]
MRSTNSASLLVLSSAMRITPLVEGILGAWATTGAGAARGDSILVSLWACICGSLIRLRPADTGIGSLPKLQLEPPPGGAWTRVVGRLSSPMSVLVKVDIAEN